MAADGSIIIETNVDDKEAQKHLNELNEQIKTLEKSLSDSQKKADSAAKSRDNLYSKFERENAKYIAAQGKLSGLQEAQSPLIVQADEIRSQLEAARQQVKLFGDQWKAGIAGADKEQTAAQEHVKQLSQDYESVLQRVEKMDPAILKATSDVEAQKAAVDEAERAWENAKHEARNLRMEADGIENSLNKAKEEAGGIEQRLAAADDSTKEMHVAMEKTQKSADSWARRLREVVRSALVFTVISQGLASLREWFGKVVKSNDEATAAIARLKGALLTLAQPLLNVIIPAFSTFVNLLATIVSVVSSFLSALFGSTQEQAASQAEDLYNQAEALEATGNAAKKAGKSLASFDEINKLSSGASGSAIASDVIKPDFDFDSATLETDLNKLLNLIKVIGTALLTLRFSKGFLGGIRSAIGFFMALDGTIGLAKSTWDAWQNGLNSENLFSMLGRATELVLGLLIALGPMAAAIGLIVSGITFLATAFKDADANGWNFYNTALAITGILAAGLGISILTGSWIPLLISAIAGALLSIVNTFGDGEKLIEDFKLILSGFVEFVQGVFSGDLSLALSGIGKIFEGLQGVVDNVFSSIENMIGSFFDWLDEKTGGQFTLTINFIKDILLSTLSIAKESLQNFISSFRQILEGLITFITGVFSGNWDTAWDGLVEIGKGAVNLLISMVESFVNFWINGLNTLIKALNSISFSVPEWVPVLGGRTYGVNIPLVPNLQIPRLAQGAVIPPNREFLAVLGDQKSGNNIEAPEQLIRSIVREESGAGSTAVLREILAAIREGKVMMVDKKVLASVVQSSVNTAARASGGAALKV